MDNFFEKEKMTIPFIAMVISCFLMICLTNSMALSLYSSMLVFFVFLFSEEFLKNEKFRNKVKKYIKVLYIILLILFITDTISTNYSVNHKKIGYEANPVVVFIWSIFGTILGEIFRNSLAVFCFTFIYLRSKSNNPKVTLLSLFLIVGLIMVWILVDFNNISQLFQYNCQ